MNKKFHKILIAIGLVVGALCIKMVGVKSETFTLESIKPVNLNNQEAVHKDNYSIFSNEISALPLRLIHHSSKR